MVQILYILLGTSLTVSFSIALGMVLLDRLQLRLSRIERLLAAFPTGAACLHLLVFALAVAG
ncbi:MAG: hypothetical protein HY822_20120, partial [Acidobacteria bacterium]|nr:hypothetical protein [Acidobacteriota bacterium]